MRYYSICRRKNIGGRAVILFKLNHCSIRVSGVEVKYILDSSSAEAVDTLIVITYYHNVSSAISQKLGENKLGIVGILILVYKHVSELVLIILEHVRIIL